MFIRILLSITVFLVFMPSVSESVVTSREYPYLYKSPKAMGMGGAYVAIGGRTDTLFYNPAGLGTIPREEGMEVNLFGITGEIGKNVRDFADDLQDAFDTGDLDGDGDEGDDQLRAVNDVLADYRGENLHVRVADFSSYGQNFDSFALAVGGLASLRFDAMPHHGFGSNGILEVDTAAIYGGLVGLSISPREGLHVGGALKYFHTESVVHAFTALELAQNQDNLEDLITKDLKESGNAFGFDVGAIYQFSRDSAYRPSVGLSVLNIGDLDFGDAGEIPMTINLGFAVRPEIPWFKGLTLGLDYVDLFNNYEQDSDIGKRLRYGVELVIVDKMLAAAAVRAGMYQGHPTFGADVRLLVVTVSYVTYAEEIGAYPGQDEDRRHLVMLNVGW